ncbi:metallophosphoesterase [Lacticaseibacillus zhaodongensis]|uniref:metallophosphoesterase n=1 Tax=Lacticaseibacillus zhaodongensis TaxID=2668065 RepID=UPI0012D35C96|nr:metallophosphoesterase [Lacticaseibacillus zhaodongensis]
MTVIAVSDIHGSMTVVGNLRRMQARYPDAYTIFCGDYFDGHEHSAEVVGTIMRQVEDKRAVAILGNHDLMFSDYMEGGTASDLWYVNNGDQTITSMLKYKGITGIDPRSDEARHDMIDSYQAEKDFVRKLPTICVYGKMLFIHAGLDLNSADPLRDTKPSDRIWIREDYIYRADRSDPIFAHNPLDYTLVTGHTPTGLIGGRFDGSDEEIKTSFPKCPILKIAYPDECARYFIDGGVHSGQPENQGNIAVFDEQTGELIDSLQTRA